MHDDEQQIRELVKRWMDATRAGDTQTVLSLIADDVVFLLPGRPPMRKQEFAANSVEQAKPGAPRIDGTSEIQEIKVFGDWAFMWTKLRVAVSPPGDAPQVVRAGHTLTVLKKEAGRWVVARDANLLAPLKE